MPIAEMEKRMIDARRSRLPDEELEATLEQLEDSILLGKHDQFEELMDKLWGSRSGVAQKLADRLAGNRFRIPLLAFQMLPLFAGRRTRSYLLKVAQSTSAGDILRFDARRRAGWPQRGQARARLAFLATLHDQTATLVEALRQAVGGPPFPPEGEMLAEVLEYLLILPPQQAIEVIDLAAGELGRALAWVLRGLLHSREPQLRSEALRRIVAINDLGAAGAMDRATRLVRHPDFTAEVEAARRQLQPKPTDGRKGSRARRLPELHSAYLSPIDGDGGQAAIVLRRRSDDEYLVLHLLFKDGWGLKEAFGSSRITWQELTSLFRAGDDDRLMAIMSQKGDPEIPLVEIGQGAVRGAMEAAIDINAATRRPLPPAFEIWEPLMHDQDPPPAAERAVHPELDETGYESRGDLLRESGRLGDHPFFGGWFFDPDEIQPLLPSIPSPKGQQITERQLRPLVEALVDARMRELLRRRLRRQAWLFSEAGDRESRDLAMAAAAGLAGSGPELANHPLLQAMVMRSLNNLFGVEFSRA